MTMMLRSALIVAVVTAHPEKLTCNDPRFLDGGKMMGAYVTTNELSADISFTASREQYIYNESVSFTIAANGSRFVDEPKGVYLAIQIDFTGPNGEAQGVMHDFSADLSRTPNCASSLYSITGSPFTGESTFSWTPTDHAHEGGRLRTRGNATFKLLWANGPGGSDPLSGALGVPNTYLYMKTITLWGPEKWNPGTPPTPSPPPAPGSDACVLPTEHAASFGSHAFKGSPVFVQRLDGDAKQTFPAQRCIRCRADQRKLGCRSARVDCPTEPGTAVVERVWLGSDACEGEPSRSTALPLYGDVACPGPDHHSPFELELSRFVPKLQRDHPAEFPNNATAEEAIGEYRRMLLLMQRHPNEPAVPSKRVDLVWHSHILDTEKYKRDTLRMFGHYVHHAPSFGGADEKDLLVQQQARMLENYEAEFGAAPQKMWGLQQSGIGEFGGDDFAEQASPDCCSAQCVKPNCASCVGCNALDCGYLVQQQAEEGQSVKDHLAPAQFAGYVPAAPGIGWPLESAPNATYLCSASPTATSNLSWTIAGEYIYFRHEFFGHGWYGVGLNNATAMSGADYTVVFPSGNYSGIRDMYMWNTAAGGYPCWDVLFECSAGNSTQGTMDLEDRSVTRDHGTTVATWNRKLVTGDYKDWQIMRNSSAHLLFANGLEDFFRYHGSNFGACESVDFFSGKVDGCWWAQ